MVTTFGLLVGGLILSGCGGGATADAERDNEADEVQADSTCEVVSTIGFSHPTGDVAAIRAIKQFVSQRAQENGCVNLLLDNTVANDLGNQRETLETWVTQEVDAIVVWPVDDEAVEGLREQAQTNGTKWITYAAPIPEQDGSVGFDNDTAGEEMANLLEEWIEKNHPDGDVTAMVTTATALPALKGRSDNIINKLHELDITIVSEQDCIVPECGMQLAEDVLQQHADARIFIGLNDDAAVGTLRAVQNTGNNPNDYFIAGYDGSEEALTSLHERTGYTASAAIPLRELGYSIIDNSVAAISGEGDANNLTPMEIVTTENAEQVEDLLSAFDN